jgi:hypothetical protein
MTKVTTPAGSGETDASRSSDRELAPLPMPPLVWFPSTRSGVGAKDHISSPVSWGLSPPIARPPRITGVLESTGLGYRLIVTITRSSRLARCTLHESSPESAHGSANSECLSTPSSAAIADGVSELPGWSSRGPSLGPPAASQERDHEADRLRFSSAPADTESLSLQLHHHDTRSLHAGSCARVAASHSLYALAPCTR